MAQLDWFHRSTIDSFSRYFLTTPVPAARGSLVTRRGVRVRCLKVKDWRGTEVVGPSMMAYRIVLLSITRIKYDQVSYAVVVDDFGNHCDVTSGGARLDEDN